MRRHGSRRRRDGGDQFAEVSRERLAARAEEEPVIADDGVEEEPVPPTGSAIEEVGIHYDAGEPTPEA
jgi:hypothetical protein